MNERREGVKEGKREVRREGGMKVGGSKGRKV